MCCILIHLDLFKKLRDVSFHFFCRGFLKEIQAGNSVAQVLDQLIFGEQARLKREFQNLYAALFKNNTLHEKIIATLVNKRTYSK
jgi:hypothetical protein